MLCDDFLREIVKIGDFRLFGLIFVVLAVFKLLLKGRWDSINLYFSLYHFKILIGERMQTLNFVMFFFLSSLSSFAFIFAISVCSRKAF